MYGVAQTGAVSVGHNPLGIGFQRECPRGHPVIHGLRIAAGILEGRVAAAGDEMLHARLGTTLYLNGGDLSAGHGAGILRILAVPAAQLLAVGMQHHVDAHGAALQRVNGPQLLRKLQIVGSAESVMRGIDHAAPRVVLAVVRDDHRDAQAGILRNCLHGVVIGHLLLRGAVGIVQMCGNLQLIDVVPHRLGGEGRVVVRHGALGGEHVPAVGEIHALRIAAGVHMIEQTRLFLQRHLVVQVPDALVYIKTPVLILVQRAVAVQILELQSVHGENLRHAIQIAKLGLRVRAGNDRDRCIHLIVAGESSLRRLLRIRGQSETAKEHDCCQK